MSSPFRPEYSGVYKPLSLRDDFIEKLAARVDKGLFPVASSARNRYRVVERSDDSLRFCSVGLPTGINIGINDVNIQVARQSGEIRYGATYWTWARYNIFLCLGIGLSLGVVLLTPLLGLYLLPKEQYPPLSVMKIAILPMVIFWGLAWPWILVLIHKRPAKRCLTRILDEVNTATD